MDRWMDAPARDRIIVALDCGADEALALGETLADCARWVKVGMTLFYREGPAIVERFKKLGFQVFVDLKLHDIPHQVEGAAASVAACGADLMTVHSLGGEAMMRAACEAAAASPTHPAVIAVTILTSMDAQALTSVGVDAAMEAEVSRLARLASDAGASGVVASPQEAARLRELLGPDALIVTPGVRPADAKRGDQRRVATPAQAFAWGASHIVVGRPITAAADPKAAFESIAASLA